MTFYGREMLMNFFPAKKLLALILVLPAIFLMIPDNTSAADKAVSDGDPVSEKKITKKEAERSAISVDPETIPVYDDEPFTVINDNIPGFTEQEMTTEPFEYYSSLDNDGRCDVAYANICRDIMPLSERGAIGNIKPSGWQFAKYDCVDGKYLYNRCHLIGFQLAGENANPENLITGTRYLNVAGMLPFEDMVADYVRKTDNHVLYRVTPVFNDDDLLASGILMEARSVEDNGSGVQFCVYCYNTQPCIDIDYSNGKSEWDGTYPDKEAAGVITAADLPGRNISSGSDYINSDTSSPVMTYILNTRSGSRKFHYPECDSVKKMSEKNRKEYTGTREEIIAMGFDPCKNCNP